jgi:hypothetical protein
MQKNAIKCNKTQSKWCVNKHEASKIIDTFETYPGPSSPMFSSVHEHEIHLHCWLSWACSLTLPSYDSCIFFRALEDKILIYNLHQSIPPLSERNPLNQDLRVIGWPSPLFFVSISSITFVALVGFEREGFEHISWCSCFAFLHSIELSIPICSSERPWACYSWRVIS